MATTRLLIDTDFHRYADDHEALAMLAPLVRRREIDLIGITTVTGNAWASICARHARDALPALGLEEVPVVEGTMQPLVHRQSDFAHRSRMYGAAFGGAWGNAELLEKQALAQPLAKSGSEAHAVSFIVNELRNSAKPVTVLSIGPLTNLALALRIAPDIAARIDSLIAMGGAVYQAGNVTPSAEFNWWFDPEAASIVLEQDIRLTIVPLDATDKIVIDQDRYHEMQSRYGSHPFFRSFYEPKFGASFDTDASFSLPVWDALAAACLIDPAVIVSSEKLWLTVDCSMGASYGRVISYSDAASFNLEVPSRPRATVVMEADEDHFWTLYQQLVFESSEGC